MICARPGSRKVARERRCGL